MCLAKKLNIYKAQNIKIFAIICYSALKVIFKILPKLVIKNKKIVFYRFIQVETGFFWKWWQKQPFHVQLDVIDLVNRGQLEMINGAWSMNDEATTNYQSTIDQYTWGLR